MAAICTNSPGNLPDPDPAVKTVRIGDTVIEYRIRRSRRRKKTIQIAVNGDGVVVAAPARTPNRELKDLVTRRSNWILRRLSEWEQRPEPEPLQFVSGETLPYRGGSIVLVVQLAAETRSGVPEVSFCRGRLQIIVPTGLTEAGRQEQVREGIVAWYREGAAVQVQDWVNRWWPALGKGDSARILIRNQRRRWGSCAHDRTLRFNWRVAMLEPSLTEYVVVHELAHLTHMNHSPAFWSLVSQHLPDTRELRQRLKAVGPTLPL